MKNLTKQKVKTAIQENVDILSRYQVKSIALFGSFARNQQDKKSDIDFLVEFGKPTFDNYVNLSEALRKLFNRKVDLVSVRALKPRIKPYILREAEWLKRS